MTILVPQGHGERAVLFGVLREGQLGNQIFQDADAAALAARDLLAKDPHAEISVAVLEVRIARRLDVTVRQPHQIQ